MSKHEILFCDDDLLIVNKPSGLLCVPGLSEPENLFDTCRQDYPNIRVVHRLDMATSGIVLFALNHFSQKHLGQQFERRQVKKRYRAIVDGVVTEQTGEISAPMICDWVNRPRQKIDWHNGKIAHTQFEVLQRTEFKTELALFPVTGRSHQLRVHCLALGHPICGDALYNVNTANNPDRLKLHAEWISFQHPRSQQDFSVECPAPFSIPEPSDQ